MAHSLEDRIDFIRTQIRSGEYNAPARESTTIIEGSFRELYRRGIGLLDGKDRQRVNQAEEQIGNGSKTLEEFTLGQLVALFRNSGFLTSWARVTGNQLRGIQMINLDELVKLRNALTHGSHEATRSEAELLFQCLQAILETFGIMSLEAVGQNTPSAPKPLPTTGSRSKRQTSTYVPTQFGEERRLGTVAAHTRALDERAIDLALGSHVGGGLTVLDIGCADGQLTMNRFSDERFAHVLGVDRDANAIGAAAERAGEDTKFTFLHIDVEKEDLESLLSQQLETLGLPRLDLVFTALTLHQLANPIKLLRSCRYLLGESGAIVVRGFEDGSKLAWPDPDGHVERIIEITERSPGVLDFKNGRKLYNQLYRAGFRTISILNDLTDTAGMSQRERAALFLDSFSYRTNYLQRHVDEGKATNEQVLLLEELQERLEELELLFEDDGFYFVQFDTAAVAQLGATRTARRQDADDSDVARNGLS